MDSLPASIYFPSWPANKSRLNTKSGIVMAALWGKSYLMGSMRVSNKLRLGSPGTTRNTNTNKAQKTSGFMQTPKSEHEKND